MKEIIFGLGALFVGFADLGAIFEFPLEIIEAREAVGISIPTPTNNTNLEIELSPFQTIDENLSLPEIIEALYSDPNDRSIRRYLVEVPANKETVQSRSEMIYIDRDYTRNPELLERKKNPLTYMAYHLGTKNNVGSGFPVLMASAIYDADMQLVYSDLFYDLNMGPHLKNELEEINMEEDEKTRGEMVIRMIEENAPKVISGGSHLTSDEYSTGQSKQFNYTFE